MAEGEKTVFDFEVENLMGEKVKLDKYRGKVLLITNVASQCGLTDKNYDQMNELFAKYKEDGLEILAFPCNQFGGQEPGNEKEIREYLDGRGIKFDVFAKIAVNGKEEYPLFKFLKSAQKGFMGDFIKWNFTKFLVNRQGIPVKRYAPTTEPKEIDADIKKLLAEKDEL